MRYSHHGYCERIHGFDAQMGLCFSINVSYCITSPSASFNLHSEFRSYASWSTTVTQIHNFFKVYSEKCWMVSSCLSILYRNAYQHQIIQYSLQNPYFLAYVFGYCLFLAHVFGYCLSQFLYSTSKDIKDMQNRFSRSQYYDCRKFQDTWIGETPINPSSV